MYELFGMKQILLNYVFMQNYDFNLYSGKIVYK